MRGSDRRGLCELVDAGNESSGGILAPISASRRDIATMGLRIDCQVESAADLRATIAAESGDTATLQRLAEVGSNVAEALLEAIRNATHREYVDYRPPRGR